MSAKIIKRKKDGWACERYRGVSLLSRLKQEEDERKKIEVV